MDSHNFAVMVILVFCTVFLVLLFADASKKSSFCYEMVDNATGGYVYSEDGGIRCVYTYGENFRDGASRKNFTHEDFVRWAYGS